MVIVVKKYYIMMLCLIFLLAYIVFSYANNRLTPTVALPTEQKLIYIDAGHGGFDPGRVGQQGLNEKDLNLAIALKLQNYLENSGAKVVVTRLTDEGLYEQTDKSKKRTDMRNRKEQINNSGCDIVVSIHQNSFTQSKYKGPQVFYHKKSKEAKALALSIQQELNDFVAPENNREAKENDTYYILKQTQPPAVIVECGFISNPEEELLLNNEEYQQKISWAIYVAILKYFGEA